ARATLTKSKYFEPASSEAESESVIENEESGYEDEDAAVEPSSEESEVEDDTAFSTEEDTKPKKKAGRRTLKSQSSSVGLQKRGKGSELLREGADIGLLPGTQVIIDKPKARPAGGTPYSDDTIHPNTMLFLGDLAKNNQREWLKTHDLDYRQSLQDFQSFLESMTQKLIEVDETIPELPVKDIIFRIYRDVRFSKDQTPYKGYYQRTDLGTGPYAAYYLQIKPNGSYVGGGLWQPESQPLAALRMNINQDSSQIKSVLINSQLRKEFLGGISNDETKAVKAFAGQNAENALKSRPQGYDADHKDIELLRLRSFTIGRKLGDDEVLGAKGFARMAHLLSCLVPFITYLNSVVMPDQED
ncbi:hypothetical protein M501DRAFT_917038, partial [Patellaria atrata CBS 101060]